MSASHKLVRAKRSETCSSLVLRMMTTLVVFGFTAFAMASTGDTTIVRWNDAALIAIRDTHPGPPMAARMISITNTCMYDA